MCVCVINALKNSQEKKTAVFKAESKTFFILLHKGDVIVFYGNSDHESTYMDIIFL